eukprot:9623171-Prorocentrum_lima.AAC.1
MEYVQTQRVGPVRMMIQCRSEKLASTNFDRLKSKLASQNISIIVSRAQGVSKEQLQQPPRA